MKDFIKNILTKKLNETLGEPKTPEIVITPIEPDERSNKKKHKSYNVNYSRIVDNGVMVEIEGRLIPYHTGRSEEHSFEPSYFSDEQSENYYDNNWEDIEEEILTKFHSTEGI